MHPTKNSNEFFLHSSRIWTIVRIWMRILILTLCTFVPLQAYNASLPIADNFRFIRYSTQDGLPSDKVLDILQDQYGFMWFATENGLSRFDGIHFVNYTHSSHNKNSLSNNVVTSLAEDRYGNLWIGTQNGLNRYDRIHNHFQQYTTQNGLKNNFIRAIHVDKEDNLWIETAQGYLTQYCLKDNKWQHFKHSPGTNEGNHFYWQIYEDSLQNLWIGGRALHGFLFSKKSYQFTPVPTWSDKGMPLESAFYVKAPDGSLFSSSFGSVQKYDFSQHKFIHYRSIPFEATCAVTDKKGFIWIGGYGGLLRWHYPQDKIELLTSHPDIPYSLSSNQILCLYTSNDGCVWIGTENGINLYAPQNNLFHTYTGYKVTALMEDKNRHLWVGTQDDGSYVFDFEKKQIDHFNYLLMTKDIDYHTFQREKEIIRQYIRHEAIYNEQHALSENLADNFQAYKNADLHFRYPDENHVSALYQDNKGLIYVGLWNHVGFNVYNPQNRQWKRYALWSKKPDYHYPRLWLGNPFGANWYNGFLEDRKGRFWCITWECFGLNLFNRKTGKFEFKHYFPNNVPCFPQGKIEQIFYDKNSDRYIFNGKSTYFGYYDNQKKRFYKFGEHFPDNYTNLDIIKGYYQYSKAKIFSLPNEFGCEYILPDGYNRLYMANAQRIMYMNLTDNSVHQILSMPGNTSFAWTLSANKQLLILYCDKGFMQVDLLKHTYKPLPQNINLSENEEVKVILQTLNHELLAGTSKNLWKQTPRHTWGKLLPENQTVNLLRETENDKLYVGGSKGLYIFQKGKIQNYIPFSMYDSQGLPGTEIRDIYISDSTTCWIATNDGLAKLGNGKIEIFEHHPLDPYSLIDNNVCAISKGPDHKLWIATYQGLCLLNPVNGRFTDMTQPGNDCLTSRLTSCITEDNQGNIWIGTTEKGINVLSIEADTLTHYYHQSWNPYSLPDNYVECIFCSQNGNIWIGTHQGLVKYNGGCKPFQRISQTEELQVKGIQEDSQQHLWITTNKGLLLSDANGNILRKFHDYHGLTDNNLSRAICSLTNGNIVIGGNNGFSLFSPQQLSLPLSASPIMITDIEVNSSPFSTDLNKKKQLFLEDDQNSFTIGFAAADYAYSTHLKYRYKLVPFEEKWNYTMPPLLTAKYTNIPFGQYYLEIETTNAYGEWSNLPLKVSIQIAPPWYYSWWFLTIFIVSSILGGWSFIRFRERHLRKENEQLETLVKERTNKLYQIMENKNKFFNIVSHDLKSPLNSVNVLSTILLEDYNSLNEEEKLQKIRMISKTSRQGKKLLDNLQLWVLSQKEIIKPVFRQTNLTDEIEAVIQLLNPDIQKKELIITAPTQAVTVYTDKNMLSTILRNLIANAIKYSYRKGCIQISVQEEKDYWHISIKDNGVGMSAERTKKLFQIGTKVSSLGTEKEEGTGLGLLIVKEFINRLGESIQVKSIQGKGSIFTFTLHKTIRR